MDTEHDETPTTPGDTATAARGTLPEPWFDRVDPEPDTRFYQSPRLVQHIDAGAIAAVGDAVRRHVPPGSDVLDLMSSWVSHLPPAAELPLGRVTGLGMNADELAANPRLSERAVRDLNADPRLPYPDASIDAVLITVSIQYLTRPDETLREVARVLRPGGVLLVSFSKRNVTQYPTSERSRSAGRGPAAKPAPLPLAHRGPSGAPGIPRGRDFPPLHGTTPRGR